LPSNTPSLIIPQEKLDVAFNVATNNTKDNNKIELPLEFNYMSQGFSSFHPAIDLATKYGTSIKPIKAGVVKEAGYSPFGYGNEVLINHGDGMESLYAHLSKIEVKTGDEVTVDSEIGLVGTTGHSTGPHLHLEIHQNGKSINPLTILPSFKSPRSLLTLNQQ